MVSIVGGEFDQDEFQVTLYPNNKDLCNPSFRPIFVIRVPGNKNEAPTEWDIIIDSDDVYYKADPRKTDLLRDWSEKKKFPRFLPVYQIKKIGYHNRCARIARARLNEWIRNTFTFLQTEGRSATPAG